MLSHVLTKVTLYLTNYQAAPSTSWIDRELSPRHVAENGFIRPSILSNPISKPTVADSYHSRWKKLLVMELKDNLTEYKRNLNMTKAKADFKISIRIGKQSSQSFKFNCDLVDKSDSGCMTPADIIYAIIHLENHRWMFVTQVKVDFNDPAKNVFPCECKGILYDENFSSLNRDAFMPGDTLKTIHGYLWESFTSFMYRFHALSEYNTEVLPGIKLVIESGKLPKNVVIKDIPIINSKLNVGQLKALKNVVTPVDFIHGPPGTGKSTIISEFIRHRVPVDENALICTTTNKAIDSLAEKLEREGFGKVMLAFGNEAKLGVATQKFLLENRVESHPVLVSARRIFPMIDTENFPHSKSIISRIEKVLSDTLKIAFSSLKNSLEEFILRVMGPILEGLDNVMFHFITHFARLKVNATVEILKSARIFVCTASTAVRLPDRFSRMCEEFLKKGDMPPFICQQVILDEAGAMLEPDIIGTLIHGCKSVLLVGDHLQLPPFTKWGEASKYQFDVSLLQRLSKSVDHNILTTQYRMHASIASIASEIFYKNVLKTDKTVARIRKRKNPVEFINISGFAKEDGFSYFNQKEADKVVSPAREGRT